MSKFDFSGFDFFNNNNIPFSRYSAKTGKRRKNSRSCRIEELEGREMLSVTPWSLANDFGDMQSDVVQTEVPQNSENTIDAEVGPTTPLLALADVPVLAGTVNAGDLSAAFTFKFDNGASAAAAAKEWYVWLSDDGGTTWTKQSAVGGVKENAFSTAVNFYPCPIEGSGAHNLVEGDKIMIAALNAGAPDATFKSNVITVSAALAGNALDTVTGVKIVGTPQFTAGPAGTICQGTWTVTIGWDPVAGATNYDVLLRFSGEFLRHADPARRSHWRSAAQEYTVVYNDNGTATISGLPERVIPFSNYALDASGSYTGYPQRLDYVYFCVVASANGVKSSGIPGNPGVTSVEGTNRTTLFLSEKYYLPTFNSGLTFTAGTHTYNSLVFQTNSNALTAGDTLNVVVKKDVNLGGAGVNEQDMWRSTLVYANGAAIGGSGVGVTVGGDGLVTVTGLDANSKYTVFFVVERPGHGYDSTANPIPTSGAAAEGVKWAKAVTPVAAVANLVVPPHVMPANIKGNDYVTTVTFTAPTVGTTTLYSIDENLHIGAGKTYADIAAARTALEANQNATGWVAQTTATAGANSYEFAYKMPDPIGWIPDPHTRIHFVCVTKEDSNIGLSATSDLRISPVIAQSTSTLSVTKNGDGTLTIDWRDTDHAAMYTPIAEIIPQFKDASGVWRECVILGTTLNNGTVVPKEGHAARPDSMPISVKVEAPTGFYDKIEFRLVTYVRPVTMAPGYAPANEGEWGTVDWNAMFGTVQLATVTAKQEFFPQQITLKFDVVAGKYYQMKAYELALSDATNGTIHNVGGTGGTAFDDWYSVVGVESIWTVYAEGSNLRLNGATGTIVGTIADGKATWLFDDLDRYFTAYGFTIAEVDASGAALTAESSPAVAWTRLEPLTQVGPIVDSSVTLKLPASLLDLITKDKAVFLSGNMGGTVGNVPTVLSVREAGSTTGYFFGATEVDGKLGADFNGVPSNGLGLTVAFNKANGTYTISGLQAGVNYEFFYRLEFPAKVGYDCAGLNGTIQNSGRIFSGLIPVSATAAAKLAKPVVTAGTPTANSITLTWAAVAGEKYLVQYRTGSGGWKTWDTNLTAGTTVVGGLAQGTAYEFRVKALAASADIDSEFGTASASTIVTKLSAPTGLATGAITDSSVALSWNAVAKATGYEVQYKTGSNAWQTFGTVTGTTAVVNELVHDTSYEFRVRALAANAADNSDWSDVKSETTRDKFVPVITPPVADSSKVTITWKAGTQPDGNFIQYQKDGGAWITWCGPLATGNASVEVTGLASGSYKFRYVDAIGTHDIGTTPVTVTASTGADPAVKPKAAALKNAKTGATNVGLDFVTLQLNAKDVAAGKYATNAVYEIAVTFKNGKVMETLKTLAVTAKQLTDGMRIDGLAPGTAYTFNITAKNADGVIVMNKKGTAPEKVVAVKATTVKAAAIKGKVNKGDNTSTSAKITFTIPANFSIRGTDGKWMLDPNVEFGPFEVWTQGKNGTKVTVATLDIGDLIIDAYDAKDKGVLTATIEIKGLEANPKGAKYDLKVFASHSGNALNLKPVLTLTPLSVVKFATTK